MLEIKEPCHENWNEFTPTQKGAFCDKCQIDVIDFSQKSNQELKNTQTKLIEHEKLASIGLLSSGVAHEINNPLSSVNSNILSMQEYVEILASNLKSEDEKINFIIEDLPDLINDCLIATKQINTIVSGLKTFSSTQNQTTLKETYYYSDYYKFRGGKVNVLETSCFIV